MNPMFGAAAMSVSSFIVVTNALRINLFKIYDPSKDKKKKSQAVESSDSLTKVLKVKGMMCGHCEARVKDALLKLDEVKSAEADYKNGTVYITLNSACDDEKLKEAIINAGYKVK
jgi:Cu2+-exporting ATPase